MCQKDCPFGTFGAPLEGPFPYKRFCSIDKELDKSPIHYVLRTR